MVELWSSRFGVSEYLLALAFLRGAGDVMAAL